MMIIKTLLLIGVLFTASSAWATDRYVSPSGSGSTCSSGTPCSLNTGLAATVAGDTLILKDGNYNQELLTVNDGTVSNRITVQAENRHAAVLRPPACSPSCSNPGNGKVGIRVTKDYYTFKGIKVDGQSANYIGVFIFNTKTNITFGTTLEDIWTLNTGNNAIAAQNAENILIKFSKFQNAGMSPESVNCCAEGLYFGSADNDSGRHVSNVEVIGSTWINAASNMTDFKINTTNIFVHHSRFRDFQNTIQHDQGTVGNEAIFQTAGNNGSSNNRFEDVIVHDSTPTSVTNGVQAEAGVSLAVRDSVFYNITGMGTSFLNGRNGSTLTTSGITACNLNRYNIAGSVSQSGNSLNVAQSNCDNEVARIISEIAAPPMIADCEIGNLAADKIVCTWINDKFPPLKTITNGLFSATVDTGGGPISRTITESVINGQNTEHTLASAVSAGNTVRITGSAGAVVNSGEVGDTWISDLAASESFTNQVVTNNVGGGGAFDLSQNEFRFHHLRGPEAAPLCLHHDNCASSIDQNALRPKGAKYRIRIGLHCDETGDCPSFNVRLRYSYNEGAFVDLTESFVNGIRAYGSNDSFEDIPSHGSATTELLTSQETTNIACAVVRDAVAIPNVNLSQDSETECEWVVEHDETPSVGDTYDFEIYDDQGNPVHSSADPIVRPRFTIKHYYASGGF